MDNLRQYLSLDEFAGMIGINTGKAAKEVKGVGVKEGNSGKGGKPGHLTFLIGAARSGKSTIAQKWVSERTNRIVVSCDKIRLALYGIRYASTADIFVEAIEDVTVRLYLEQGYDILIDETNTTDRRIKKCFGWDIGADYHIVEVPLEVLKHRCYATKQDDMLKVVERHTNNIKELSERWGDNIHANIERLRHQVRMDPPIKRIAV